MQRGTQILHHCSICKYLLICGRLSKSFPISLYHRFIPLNYPREMSEAEIDPPDTAKADDVPPDSIKEESIEQPIVDEEEKKELPTETITDAGNTADESLKRELEEAVVEQDDAKKAKIENGGDKYDPDPIPASTEGLSSFNDADVLSGRGGGTNVHPGNRSFRDLINMHRRAYLKARKNDKPAISRAIVRSIRDANGRFLRKDEKTGLWFEIGDDAAREKNISSVTSTRS